jgi:hypothetical protein
MTSNIPSQLDAQETIPYSVAPRLNILDEQSEVSKPVQTMIPQYSSAPYYEELLNLDSNPAINPIENTTPYGTFNVVEEVRKNPTPED